jgi:ParB-like chromosome segregation protein Spo0J
MIKKVKISEVKPNPNNPRLIKDDKFKKLVKSIQDFPDMLNVRPIVVNKDMIVLGGNMRLKAIKEAGHTEVAIEIVDWTEEQQKEFIVKDNVGYGEWDWDDLANNWDSAELTDWGLDIPNFDNGDYSDKNKEINIDDIEDSMTINLKYTEEEYLIVKEALSKIASTPEMAIWKLIGNE